MLITVLLQDIKNELNPTVVTQLIDTIFARAVVLGEKILIAAVVFFIGSWIISILRKLVKKLLARKAVDPAVSSFVNSLVNMLLKVMLFIVIISILGIETTSFAALIAAAGLAVGMAMKDNLANFAGGVMILLNKPFAIDDYIIAQGQEGSVTQIGILYTVLLTGDGRTVYLPNGPLSTGSIVNNSNQQTRRVDLTFNINYGNNVDELKKTLSDIINSSSLVIKDPAPFIGVTAVNNGNFDITIRVWGKNADFGDLSEQLNTNIYKALNDKGVFVSYPVRIKLNSEDKSGDIG